MDQHYNSTKYAISKLDAGGAWDNSNQTHLARNGSMTATINKNVEYLPVLNGVEGRSKDGFVSTHEQTTFNISQAIELDDIALLTSCFENGYSIGLYHENGNETLVFDKCYIDGLTIDVAGEGAIPVMTITGWGGKPADVTAKTLVAPTQKPAIFKDVFWSAKKVYSLNVELMNNIKPLWCNVASLTDSFPNGKTDRDLDGNFTFVCGTDTYETYDDIVTDTPPYSISDSYITIGTYKITMAEFVSVDDVERKAERSDGNQLFTVSGAIANDNTNNPFAITAVA